MAEILTAKVVISVPPSYTEEQSYEWIDKYEGNLLKALEETCGDYINKGMAVKVSV